MTSQTPYDVRCAPLPLETDSKFLTSIAWLTYTTLAFFSNADLLAQITPCARRSFEGDVVFGICKFGNIVNKFWGSVKVHTCVYVYPLYMSN